MDDSPTRASKISSEERESPMGTGATLEKGIAMENPRNRGEIRVKQPAAKDRPGEVGDMWRFYWEACGGRR